MKKLLVIFSFIFVLAACQSTNVEESNDLDNENNALEDDLNSSTDTELTEDKDDDSDIDDLVDNKQEVQDGDQASIEGEITVEEPLMNKKVASPLTVSGQAVGPWFFEGSLLVTLLDSEGNELVKASAEATEEWMTEEMVPFEASLTFDPGIATSGTLVLEKDNPSGEAQNAGKLEIPVTF